MQAEGWMFLPQVARINSTLLGEYERQLQKHIQDQKTEERMVYLKNSTQLSDTVTLFNK